MGLDSISIILHGMKGSSNIGYVARAMANTGFKHLRLSEVRCSIDSAAYRCAATPEAHRILKKAKIFDNLGDALAGLSRIVGTTARHRHNRRVMPIPGAVPAILTDSENDTVGILFGPEERGLSNSDIFHCDILVTIPAAAGQTSYNVAHAVLIVLYSLMTSLDSGTDASKESVEFASHETIQALFEDAQSSLLEIGYLNQQNPVGIMQEFREIAGRARLTRRDVALLRGICRKMGTYVKKEAKRNSGESL